MAHLAPIPEVPAQLPEAPKLSEVDWLLELVDAMLKDSATGPRNNNMVFTKEDFKEEAHH
jgi:hypothetical protein